MKHKNLTRLLSLLLTLVLLCSVCLPAYAAGLEAVAEAQMTDSAATEDLAGTEPAATEDLAGTEPADTEAADTEPADTEPADTEAADTEPEEELQNTAVPQAACTVSVLESAPTTAETTTGSIYTLDLSTVFTDSEGHTLSYTLSGGDFGQQTKIKDGVLYFSVGAAGDYTPTITATCESGATATYTPTITVKAASEGSQEQYGYDETPASSVTVYVTVNSDGIPIRGNDEKQTILSHLKVTVPYFDLADYGLGDFHRYHTENGQGSYVDDVIVERPTALHLYIYLLEHYYMGLPDSACCKGTSGVLDYATETDVYDMNGDPAYTGTNKALNITGSATSLYMQQFWGHDENLMYYRNHVYPLMSAGWGSTADYILLSDDDTIDVAMFSNWNFWSDGGAFARFDKDAYQGRAGAALAVQTLKYDTRSVADGGTESFTPISGLKVGLYDANWKLLQELSSDNGSYTVTLPETAGKYYLLGIDPNHGTMDARFASATARVTVLGDENPDPFADTLFTSVNYADNSGSTAVLDDFTALTGGISDTDGLGNVYKNLPAYTFKIPQSLIGNTVNFVFPAEQGLQPYGMSWSKGDGFGYDAPNLTLKTNDDGTQTLSFDITEDFVGTGKYIVFENDEFKGFLGVTFELGGATGAVAVTGVSLDQTALNVPLGTAPQLTATVMPENATNKDVAWSSSNKTVATVSESGVITPVSEGATIITVTTMDGSYTATCRVTVVDDRTPNLSADGYYEITSAQQLKWFADAVNSDKSSANARLMNDIDLSEVCSAENGSWEPIGTAMKYIAYSGTFDGQGHTISNLYINEKLSNTANGETNDRALFGRVEGGTIKNVTVTGSVTTNARYASGLVGYAIKATIENCHTNVAVTGTGTWGASGIIGFAASGVTIRNCSNSGPIHGAGTYVAGVVGSGYEITVDGCYNDGEIVCNDFYGEGAVGGVIGYLSSPKAKISNCYNLGTVTTDDSNYRVGGVVGMFYFYSGGTAQISSCYNAGMINSKSSKAGSLAGSVEDRNGKLTGQTAENCFYLLGTCTSDFFELSSVTEAYLRSAAATAQLNGESGSAYKRGTAHPILSWQPDEPVDTTPEKNEQGFYQLTSADDLLWFADKVNNGGLNAIDAVLMNDIDLSSVPNWTPIGSSDTKYLGTFDGQGHAITGLTIQQGDVSATLTLGLFGYAGSGAALKNFTLDGGVTLTTSQQIAGAAGGIGSVVGHANGATITDVQSSVSVTVSAPSTKNVGYVGGLAGMTTKATLLRCGYSGTLTLTLTGSGNGIHAGGIVGKAAQSKLEQCRNSGSIDVTPGSITCYVGGLVGNAVSSSAAPSNQLLNCYNAGDVTNYSAGTASQSFGGLVGYLGASSKSGGKAVIKNCFNAGTVTSGTATNRGALIGKLYANYGTRENLYYLTGTAAKGIGAVPPGATDNSIAKTAADFASADFVTLLNTNSGSESAVFAAGTEHPLLAWEAADTPEPQVVLGDVNGDGKVTNLDAALTYAAYNGTFAMTDAQRAAADVNKDGKVTNLDAALIYSYYNGTLGSFDEIGK